MAEKVWPVVPMPDFVSGPNYLNFSLDRWIRFAAPMKTNELTPDEAAHLRDSLNNYLEYTKKAKKRNVRYEP